VQFLFIKFELSNLQNNRLVLVIESFARPKLFLVASSLLKLFQKKLLFAASFLKKFFLLLPKTKFAEKKATESYRKFYRTQVVISVLLFLKVVSKVTKICNKSCSPSFFGVD